MQGIVKYYNAEKRFGFIESSGKEYFFHCLFTDDEVNEGDKVTFEIENNERGTIAVNVKVIKNEN